MPCLRYLLSRLHACDERSSSSSRLNLELIKKLKHNVCTPLHALYRPDGSITTDPNQVDELMRNYWQATFLGNVASQMQAVATYIITYCTCLFFAAPFQVNPLTGQDLMETCQASAASSQGLDHWSPCEFRLLSLQACHYLALLLNLVEEGAPWPVTLWHARGAFLSKDPSQPFQPMAYRILLVLPTLYRKWATTRLRHLGPWISTWADPAMHAGVPGSSAAEAWYSTAIDKEYANATQQIFSGASFDIHKCFDQLLRMLIYFVAMLAGCPTRILTAYFAYLESCYVHYSIAGHIGKAHRRPCGIPQGCPLSMMLVALLMRPWVQEMKAMNISPRTLADDLMLVVIGNDHIMTLVNGINATLQHIKCMGGRVASHKRNNFSTSAKYAQWLAKNNWRSVQATIPVVSDLRDLGSHLHITSYGPSTTIAKIQ